MGIMNILGGKETKETKRGACEKGLYCCVHYVSYA